MFEVDLWLAHVYMYTYMHTTISSLTDEEVRALQSLWICDLSLASFGVWKVGFLVSQGSQNSQNLTGYAHFNLPIRHTNEAEILHLGISI